MLDFKKNGKPCIYQIKNIKNGKVYIGSASGHYRRKGQHFYMLRNNRHYNKHLQSSWNKYLEGNFMFEILEFIEDLSSLVEREEFYIKQFNSTDPNKGYNHRDKCNTNLGNKWSEESKRKFSESKKGKPTNLNYTLIAEKNMKPVIATNKITGKVLKFNSVKEAGEKLGIQRTSISKVLKNINKSAGNYYWSYQSHQQETVECESSEFSGSPEVGNTEPSQDLNVLERCND